MARELDIDWNSVDFSTPPRTLAKLLGVNVGTVYVHRRALQGFKLESPAERKKQESCKSWTVCLPAHAAALIEAKAKEKGLTPPLLLKRIVMQELGFQPYPQERPDTPAWVKEHGRRVATEYHLRYYIYRNAALEAIGYPFPPKTVQSWGAYYDAVEGQLCQGGTPQELFDAFLAAWPHLNKE